MSNMLNNQSKKQSKRQLMRELKLQEDLERNEPFNIIKGNCFVNDTDIRTVVEKMISQKMEQDRYISQPFAYRHMCCLLSGIPKQWEKGGYGRELNAGGP